MSISETANRNHQKLFPNHRSTLKVTDPELIEVFDNFAFDEVLSHGDLDDRTRMMVILASLSRCRSRAVPLRLWPHPWRTHDSAGRDSASGRRGRHATFWWKTSTSRLIRGPTSSRWTSRS